MNKKQTDIIAALAERREQANQNFEEAVVDLLIAGGTLRGVAATARIAKGTVRRICKDHGIVYLNGRYCRPHRREILRDMARQGQRDGMHDIDPERSRP